MKKPILEVLKERAIFFDGAMGTELTERGIVLGESAERFSPYFSEIISEIYKLYFDAGADVIQTNTYGANRIGLGAKLENKIELINLRQVELANNACPKNGYVAGNILNILIFLHSELKNFDFSHLAVWQTYLQEVNFIVSILLMLR